MTPKNRQKLSDRVSRAADAALTAQGYVSSIDVLVGVGWLDREAVERWRKGQVDCLERVVEANLSRISEAMKLFRSWARGRDLVASETVYRLRRGPRQPLRFSRSGKPAIERLYGTHWVLRKASAKRSDPVAMGGPAAGG